MASTAGPTRVSEAWIAATTDALRDVIGDPAASALMERFTPIIPAGYDELCWPNTAVVDIPIVDALGTARPDGTDHEATPFGSDASDVGVATRMLQFDEAAPGEWRFRLYRRGASVPLADLLPLLDHLGFRALDERTFSFVFDDATTVWLHDVAVSIPEHVVLDEELRRAVQFTFVEELAGRVEVDGLNRLVLLAGLTAREAEVLRAYSRYLRQIGFPFSQQYIESALVRHAAITRRIVDWFTRRFDPTRVRDEASAVTDEAEHDAIVSLLDGIPSLDDDRTLRALLALVDATLRTNAFRPGDDGDGHRPVLAIKFDPSKVPDLPLPRPMFEIWVCSPRVEGVHLRGGRIARGGLRWSDRREDFRTEVLGLVKAQIVKNAVIVPTGAKGGFVVKRATSTPEELRAEGIACYRDFIGGLLDVTDDRVGDAVLPPPATVRHDGDDPYLVVAADKGTATFSDIANEIAQARGFWLGDAFASGGSVGYDHKAMGITARGAWESVRRHARALGRDADRDPLTIVGIGDMSGDVFGNGLLRSPNVRLVAAFDHRHVFCDPDPDPAASYAERARLFALPRSSWADYDPSLLSPGGGIFPRTAKRIDLTPEMRRVLGTDRTVCTPNELISVILRAPVDVLWNGGIGTYVKASTETHADVGDRANDGVRVDGADLRCRMVGEGGNLGLTQRGRIEYALAGGLVYTDAIDNSAGVDCSDHEVNIKILLGDVVASTGMSGPERAQLLASMTDEVADLVLEDNRAQTLALAIARRQALPMANVHARYLQQLESEGWINRSLEFLPTDKQIAERQASGTGLTTPEFAVLLAYTKTTNVELLEDSELPDDPYLVPELVRYFPSPLRQRYREQILRHTLRREIVATQVGNQMVNLSGISFDHRMSEDHGVGVVEITRAWVVARDVFDAVALWEQIEDLAASVKIDAQLEMFLEVRRMVERGVGWILRHVRPPVDLDANVAAYAPGVRQLSSGLDHVLTGRMKELVFAAEAGRLAAGVPEQLAQRSAIWPLLHTGLDVVELTLGGRRSVHEVARAYWELFDRLDVTWLWEAIGALPRTDRWQTQARAALRDDLLGVLAQLTGDVLDTGGVDAWLGVNERTAARTVTMFNEIRRADAHDITTLTVAVRQLRNLSLSTRREQEPAVASAGT